jgi:DNA polymerase III epsilon subunit-like protein
MSDKPKGLWIDLESTGTDPKTCGIHQVSCILVTDKGEETMDWKIRPFDGAVYMDGWDVGGHVTREQVEVYPLSEKVFKKQFCRFLDTAVSKFDREDKLFWLGYNARFDNDFMRECFTRNGDKFFGSYFWVPVIDIMPMVGLSLINVRSSLPNFQLATVYEHVMGVPLGDAHDGIADIKATRELFKKLYPSLQNQK